MAVITVSREFGCEGTSVAQHVARALGYHFIDKDVIKKVVYQYGFSDFDDVYESAPGFLARFDDRRKEVLSMLNDVIRALARHGDMVILGRGSFAVLANLADVLHVRIQASLPARVQWVMKHHDIADAATAEALVRDRDNARAAFVEFSYGARWDSVRAFDLVVDTDRLSASLAVRWIIEGHEALVASARAPSARPSTRTLEVNNLVEEAVSKALGCNTIH